MGLVGLRHTSVFLTPNADVAEWFVASSPSPEACYDPVGPGHPRLSDRFRSLLCRNDMCLTSPDGVHRGCAMR
jgi:hypothetical protein